MDTRQRAEKQTRKVEKQLNLLQKIAAWAKSDSASSAVRSLG